MSKEKKGSKPMAKTAKGVRLQKALAMGFTKEEWQAANKK